MCSKHAMLATRPNIQAISSRSGGQRHMTTDKQASSSIEVFREWQRCIATDDQEGTARGGDLVRYTAVCLGLTDRATGYWSAFAHHLPTTIGARADMAFR